MPLYGHWRSHTNGNTLDIKNTTKSNITDLKQVISSIGISMLGKELQPIIKKSLTKCRKDKYRQSTKFVPEFVVVFVIALVFRRDLSYPAVLDCLVSGMRWIACILPKKIASNGALSRARHRLGVDVFIEIFRAKAPKNEDLSKDVHEMTSVAFDGTGVTTPDTKENADEFGIPSGGRGKGGFPQLRSVALLVLSMGTIVDFDYANYRDKGTGERSMMNKILDRIPYAGLLLLLDAGLYAFDLLLSCQDSDTKIIAKLSSTVKPIKIQEYIGVSTSGSVLYFTSQYIGVSSLLYIVTAIGYKLKN